MKLLLEQWLDERKKQRAKERFVSDLEKWLVAQDAIRSRDPELVRKHLKVVISNG